MRGILRSFGVVLTIVSLVAPVSPSFAGRLSGQPGADLRSQGADPVLPNILSSEDVTLYREMFALARQGRGRAIDERLPLLANPLLLGHVMAQRYLNPRAAIESDAELMQWLAAYSDHPDAAAIRDLLDARRSERLREQARLARAAQRAAARSAARSGKQTVAHPIKKPIRRGGGFADAGAVLNASEPALRAGLDGTRSVRTEEFYGGPAEDMVLSSEWSLSMEDRSTRELWRHGIAAWRAGESAAAAGVFGALADRSDASAWVQAAAAFWAARAHLHARQPEHVSHWLKVAASQTRTFYGLLAQRILGLPLRIRWQPDDTDIAAARFVGSTAAGERALALVQVGEHPRAEAELAHASRGERGRFAHGAMVIAERAGLAQLSLQLYARLYPDGGGFEAASYPVPYWRPEGGFTVDPALLFALARQESRFDPEAVSRAGARGLMQVMPATARHVVRRRPDDLADARLSNPETNLAVGQTYIELLVTEEDVGQDLFRLAAAWNGGPNNVKKWEFEGIAAEDDPLLFIETIPFGETRNFIEKVLANYWIYRDRLNQPVPSLDSLAAGMWPTYQEYRDPPVSAPVQGTQARYGY
ncbi:MAG: lytic transglycosylase domain-containing protein [Defluviicoccus sp.]|nr:lytic transglycosylase domain-containing protein [Defluviicoccus sp.]MDG4591243.1 lytic transglycosylase domain-containing protein [Defluviicoccus sp.]